MLIQLHKQSQTRKHETFLIQTDETLTHVTIERNRKRTTLETLRYVINKTVGPNNGIQFLGNKRTNKKWITEWTTR